jgi:phosphoglycerol transferase MdoB-like AlkP superfamily enzyme
VFVSFQVLRVFLALRFYEDEAGAIDYALCFLRGALRDSSVALALTLPLAGWLVLAPRRWLRGRLHKRGFAVIYGLGWAAFTFSLVAEYFFFEEFKSRFNTVAIDYLLYPHEVFVNIWDSYPVAKVIFACAVLAAIAGRLCWRFASGLRLHSPSRRMAGAQFGVIGTLAWLLLAAGQLTSENVSRNRLVNELANSGELSFFHAAWSRNLDYAAFHQVLPRGEGYERARDLLSEPGSEFIGSPDSLARRVAGDRTRPRHNVIILLEESLGSEFWGALGRLAPTLTPCLDHLSTEGLLFINIYATGNRTVRGFEGVLSSFPPLPGDSIVKRDRSQNVETIARVLQRDGYRTMFLYGGRGMFDGMRSFAMHNGYERFIEQKDFAHPTFTTSWGVCNEDLYQRTLLECRELNRGGEPFFATVLSVSNHKPYTYPKSRIPEDPNKQKRSHAVRYTDWALGQFFDAARKEDFWTNTIFVVVADHGARVYGSQAIPIHSYEIPFLVLGPVAVKAPARLPQWGCQLDVAPTVLGLLGRPYDTLFFGHDLMKLGSQNGRALLNHNRDIGLATSNRLVVLGLDRGLKFYHGAAKSGTLIQVDVPDAEDRELALDALALFQTADELYMQRRYRLDATRPSFHRANIEPSQPTCRRTDSVYPAK